MRQLFSARCLPTNALRKCITGKRLKEESNWYVRVSGGGGASARDSPQTAAPMGRNRRWSIYDWRPVYRYALLYAIVAYLLCQLFSKPSVHGLGWESPVGADYPKKRAFLKGFLGTVAEIWASCSIDAKRKSTIILYVQLLTTTFRALPLHQGWQAAHRRSHSMTERRKHAPDVGT